MTDGHVEKINFHDLIDAGQFERVNRIFYEAPYR